MAVITTLEPLKSVSECTSEWLSKALNTTITSFESKRIGTGQVSAVHRLTLHYGVDETPGPATIILKVPSEDEGSRQAGILLGLYERETKFYTDVAPQIQGGAVSQCYHASFDDKTGAFSLLFSDAAPSTVGDEIHGATLEQAKLAVKELGVIHGQALRNKGLKESEWLNRAPPINQDMMQGLTTEFLEIYKDNIPENHAYVAKQMVAVFDEMTEHWRKPDVVNGLIHGDYRLDNMLFGTEGAERALTVVDWQTVTMGPFMSDFAYFLGSSIPTELRRQHTDELLQIYYEALGADSSVTLEQCKQGLRTQCFFGITMSIISPIMVERTERGDEMFMAMFARSCEQVLDLNALEVLPKAGGVREALKPNAGDEGLHSSKTDKHWQESYYLDFIDANQDIGGYIRMGIDANNNRTWYTALICGQNRPTVALVDFAAPLPDSNLRIQTSKFQASHSSQSPLESFDVLLDGQGLSYDDPSELLQEGFEQRGKPVNIRMYLRWKTSGIPYQYRITTRYEIPCLASGTVSLGDETFSLQNVTAQRDHSWGARDWFSMNWVWSAAHLSDTTRIHGLDLRAPGIPKVGIGYIQEPEPALPSPSPVPAAAEIVAPVASEAPITETLRTDLATGMPDPPEQTIEAEKDTATPLELTKAKSNESNFEPLPLTDTSVPTRTQAPGSLTELSGVTSVEMFRDNGLIQTCEHTIEPGNLKFNFEPRGHAPLRLTSDDGKISMFPRAWGKVKTEDGREGWAWMEWNKAT